MGRPRASALVPILRSEAMARTLASVLLSPEALHIRDIADRAGVSYSVVHREVERLERAGLVATAKFGAARVVRPVESHPLYPELRSLLLKAYGPRDVLAELIADVPGVTEAYLYGSWAARYLGDWGAHPQDLDVAVVGKPQIRRIEEIEAEAEDRLGQPVHIHVVGPTDWSSQQSPFIRTVRSRPMVSLREASD